VRNKAITDVPAQTSAITGPANVCGLSTANYSVTNDACAHVTAGVTDGYNWGGYGSWTVNSGGGTNSITFNVPSGPTSSSATIHVTVTNVCGQTATNASSKAVTYCHDSGPMFYEGGADAENNSISFIYPNPANTDFTIDVTSFMETELTIEVYDVLGKKAILQKYKVTTGESSLKTSIEGINDGMYFVRLVDKDNNVLFKKNLIKQ